jgi:glyoxylase-like metal-dependent hydrolase (beta-lactamase superfamily II)
VLKIETHAVGDYAVNASIVWCEDTMEGVIFDPGFEPDFLLSRINELGVRITRIINTHGHLDHIGGNGAIKDALSVPLLIHELDRPKLTDPTKNLSAFVGEPIVSPDADRLIADNEVIPIGNRSLKALHVPGHSPGSLAFYGDEFVICGDTLFYQGVGRSDFFDSSEEDLYNAIQSRLYTLPEDTVAYPGHGPTTSIGYERRHNPFVRG